MMRKKRLPILSLILIIGVLLLGACAAEEEPAAANSVDVELTEFQIRIPLEIPAGSTVFEISNVGAIEHNFVIEGQGIERQLEENLQPAETAQLRVELEPGEYVVYCPIGDHRAQGMEEQLTVGEMDQ